MAFAFLFATSSCSTFGKETVPPKKPPAAKKQTPKKIDTQKKKEIPETPETPETDVVRPNAKPSTADTITPQRQASQRLVDRGKILMEAGDLEKASTTFRDAVNVDAGNGIAYYHLAEVNAKIGKKDVALGLLDKAEALLGADEGWAARINLLRTELGASTRPIVPSPIDQVF